MRKSEIFTIGHSDLPFETFVSMLRNFKINVVCDVRSTPYSQRYTQFNRAILENALIRLGVKYLFFGEELGGRPKDPICYDQNKLNYVKQAQTVLFKRGLLRLKNCAKKYRLALMCAERDPITCHRMILVTRRLCSEEFEIRHILANACVESNQESEERLATKLNLFPSLFLDQGNPDGLMERAYDTQGIKISYKKED